MCFLIVLGNWEILNFNSGFKPRQQGCVYTSKVVCEISKFCFHEQMYMESHFKKFTMVFYLSQRFSTWDYVFLLPIFPTLGKFGNVLSYCGGGNCVTRILWIEAKDAAKKSYNTQNNPIRRII